MLPYLEKKGSFKYNKTKDPEMRRSSWIIQVVPKSNDKCPYRSEANRDYTDKTIGDSVLMDEETEMI